MSELPEPEREMVVYFGREGDDDWDRDARPYGALRVHADSVGGDPDEAGRFAVRELVGERARIDSALLRCTQDRWRIGDRQGNVRTGDHFGWHVPLDVRLTAAEALGLAPDAALGPEVTDD
jgi:hypothetical protein